MQLKRNGNFYMRATVAQIYAHVYVRQCIVKAEVPVSFTHVSTFKAFSF